MSKQQSTAHCPSCQGTGAADFSFFAMDQCHRCAGSGRLNVELLARENWDAHRELLKDTSPEWEMPSWSRAPAGRRCPYLLAANDGKAPE